MAPVVEQVAEEFQGKVKIFGMNVDRSPDTPSSMGVMSIPALLFFKGGREVSRFGGAVSRVKIAGEIEKILA